MYHIKAYIIIRRDSLLWPTLTLPLQKLKTNFGVTNRRVHALTFNNSLKYGLQADRTTRCAFRLFPSQASVTSTKSSSSRRFSKADVMLLWQLFQRRQKCCVSTIVIVAHLQSDPSISSGPAQHLSTLLEVRQPFGGFRGQNCILS